MRTVSLSSLAKTSISESTRKTLVNTFVTVAGMMVITSLISAASLDWQRSFASSLGLFAVSLLLIYAAARTRNSAWGLATLAVFAGIEGVTLGPIIAHYLRLADGGVLVATCAGLTALTALSCAGYAVTTKRDFSGMRAIIYSCTLALIIGMIIAAFIPVPALQVGLAIAGTFLFTLWMVLDVSDIVVGNQTNYVMAALSIYLDAVNIFLSLLRIFGGRR